MLLIVKGIVVEFYSPTCGTVVVKDVASIYGEGDFREMWVDCDDTNVWKPFIKQQENRTMNTTEALARLEAIEAEQKELRKLLEQAEKEEAIGSLLKSSVNAALAGTRFTSSLNCQFGTIELAEVYSKAFETFIKLRQCKGSVGVAKGLLQYILHVRDNGVISHCFSSVGYKMDNISPCFSTKEYADAAIKTVGEFEIIQMFKTFSHYEG